NTPTTGGPCLAHRWGMGRNVGGWISWEVELKVREIDIRAIKQGDNSRMSYGHIEMAKLMQSMKHEGLLHPIGVRKDGNGFVVIYGNRRLLAAQKLGWKTIAATELEDTGEADELFKNLNENMHRKDVSLAEM